MLLTEAFQCYRQECVHVIDRSVCMLLTEAFQCY